MPSKSKYTKNALAKVITFHNEETVSITFGQLFNLYIKKYAKLHTKTWMETVAIFRRHLHVWSDRPTESIKRIEIQDWIDELAVMRGKAVANRTYDVMRAVFGWAIRKEVIPHRNPCYGVDKYKVKPRDRFVQPGDEFERLAAAINAEPETVVLDFFWMCLFTGARRANVLSMHWDNINFELGTWTIPDTKNGDCHIVALIPEVVQILERRLKSKTTEWVFPSRRKTGHLSCPRKAWDRIRLRGHLGDLRIHDLRRTVGSYMAIQGTSSTIIGKALGHRSVQATAVYARLTQNPVREAFEKALGSLLNSADDGKLPTER